ncbi:hypothetical protein CMV_021348 [Castanea mollissima]|uniref:Putative E3 ubiquitin-protein ligase LIN ARM repeats domain-containing protein n=1 Tax=Castanea mollissima TaxID=60419 RepID=A0A8J4QUG3_9ROSI|nr:hypothetical protein CMV_021348 [Castanea mollissima]
MAGFSPWTVPTEPTVLPVQNRPHRSDILAGRQRVSICSTRFHRVGLGLGTNPTRTDPWTPLKATIDGAISELSHVISKLCMSEVLKESEMAVIQIERFWHEAYMDVDIKTMLSGNTVINGFMEILFKSLDPQVLKATIFLLSEMGSKAKDVIQTDF